MLPNFFVIGATRAGTTSLFQYLRQHPDIFLPDIKEVWGFNVDDRHAQLEQYYAKVMKARRDEKRVGDITPIYLTKGLLYPSYGAPAYYSDSDSAIRRISRACPDARIIVTLRSPMSRLMSQYKKNHFQGKKGVADTLEAHAEAMLAGDCLPQNDYILANHYAQHLGELYDVFDKEQVQILILEEWAKDPDASVKEMLRFLELDENAPIDTSKQYNGANNYKTKGKSLAKLFSNLRPAPKTPSGDPFRLSSQTRTRMIERFTGDIAYVESLVGRQLPSWQS
ncbi:sulfotransferase [Citreicella sp. SE45]|uniref:sulfotransferase family protein n=1 Tax=Salipiger thiooxidans TaxID=282683 RepID=UPI0001B8C358|nr:sulfotransferase [Salipiger thiooxidans]EEX13542.1 sulfotransferase [Citreicella sp. SE45]MBN8189823.1 sulfotransferase [Salipiger thiooxidans]